MSYHGKSYSHIVAITLSRGFLEWGYHQIIQIIDHFGVETHGFPSLFPTFPEVGIGDCFQQGVRRRPWCCSGRVCHQRGTWIRQNP